MSGDNYINQIDQLLKEVSISKQQSKGVRKELQRALNTAQTFSDDHKEASHSDNNDEELYSSGPDDNASNINDNNDDEKKELIYESKNKKFSSNYNIPNILSYIMSKPDMYYLQPTEPLSKQQIAKYHLQIVEQMKHVKLSNCTLTLKKKILLPILVKVTERAKMMQKRVYEEKDMAGNYNMQIYNAENHAQSFQLTGKKAGQDVEFALSEFSAINGKFYVGFFERTTKEYKMRLTQYLKDPRSWTFNPSVVTDALCELVTHEMNSYPFIVIDSSFKNYLEYNPKIHLSAYDISFTGRFREIVDATKKNTLVLFHEGGNDKRDFAADLVKTMYLAFKQNNRMQECEVTYEVLNKSILERLTWQEQGGAGFDYNECVNKPIELTYLYSYCDIRKQAMGLGYKCEHPKCWNKWKNRLFANRQWKAFGLTYASGKNVSETLANIRDASMTYKVDVFQKVWEENWKSQTWLPSRQKMVDKFNEQFDSSLKNYKKNASVSRGHLGLEIIPEFARRKGYTIVSNGGYSKGKKIQLVKNTDASDDSDNSNDADNDY
eukprot:472542_1